MSPTALTRNRSRPQGAVSVSLFPFLAVLICTLGALILLLMVVARHAQLQAARSAQAATSAEHEDLQAQREMAQWRIDQMQNSRQKTEQQLAEARAVLSHVEDHARRLEAQVAQLQAACGDLERLDGDGSQRRLALEAELAQVRGQIAEAQRGLAEAQQAAGQRRSYAVIPYQGPHGTRRRPIYIECRKDQILVQPEGIALTADDFEGPLGPGNPLAAALRAAQEYLSKTSLDPQASGEPYPLLLVRPDGIAAYYAARAALKSWGSEFGYELIGDDWTLEFQEPDPAMAQVVRQALDTARLRQERLIAAAPRHYSQARQPKFTVSPSRGIVRIDGPDEEAPGYRSQRPAGRIANGYGPSGGGPPGQAGPPEGAWGSQDSGVGAGSEPIAAGPEGSGIQGPDGSPSPGSFLGGPPREQPAAEANAAGQTGTTPRPGEWAPGQTLAEGRPAPKSPAGRTESLAKTRGRNWALPDAADGSVPITRPIRVDFYPDRLVILPEQGPAAAKSVFLRERTKDSIDELRSAIWEHMESWGMAGNGMYWRPILDVRAAPNAQGRVAEIEALLEDSGLTVRRR